MCVFIVCVYACVRVCEYVHICVCFCVSVCTCVYVCVHMYRSTYVFVCPCVHVHVLELMLCVQLLIIDFGLTRHEALRVAIVYLTGKL